ncbi:MAG: AbrB/MazE/SpoVT family DNA-binding domain-containing protein [Alphaproteobacteria bacterium]|nr:AbrB/MazE/SpoVT family DNA-binding domain-containing protein [Alphaproteobacteria bacterium]
MTTLKITQIGNSLGVILPKEVLSKLHIDKGDALYMLETQHGFEFRNYDPEFVEDMARVEKIIKENRNVLTKLADS